MQQAQDVVEKFIMPWLEKNHPEASLVFMAGSYGRAMRQGSYQPIASSDVDLVIIYTDLEKGGFRAATKVYKMEDVGAVMDGKSRVMMIDTNIHDFASLHYHDKVVEKNLDVAYINVMLDEGCILKDTLGVGPVLQERAGKFLARGPDALTKPQWAAEIAQLETFLKDIRSVGTVEEKRFLGALALVHVCDYALHLKKSWPRQNQAYRVFDKEFPEEGALITDAFSRLIRAGDSVKAETLLEDYIRQGRDKMKTAPAAEAEILHSVNDNVPPGELKNVKDVFQKFIIEHFCEALETSQKRGELAYLSNLSATLFFMQMAQEHKKGDAPHTGRDAMNYLGRELPDLMPVLLQGVDEGAYGPLRRIADDILSHMGGMHYSRLENYYPSDLARVHATAKKEGRILPKPFKPGFTP